MLVVTVLLSSVLCAIGMPDFNSWRTKATDFSTGVRGAGEEALSRADNGIKDLTQVEVPEGLPSDVLTDPDADSKPELD